MTKVLLMNFGTGARVFHDIAKMPQLIEIGGSKEVDLDDFTMKFIKKAQLTDTVMMVPLSTEMPKELSELCAIMQDMATEAYEAILTRTVMLVGKENIAKLRPTRGELRLCLRDVAVAFMHDGGTFEAAIAAASEKRRIKEDQDPGKLEQELREQEEAERNKQRHPAADKPKQSRRDRLDESLGIVQTSSTPLSGSALADHVASGGDSKAADPKPKAVKPPRRRAASTDFKPKRQKGPPPITAKRSVQRVRV